VFLQCHDQLVCLLLLSSTLLFILYNKSPWFTVHAMI
jgi:hypothetical protein